MKKIFFFILLLTGLIAQGQKLQKDNTFGREYNRLLIDSLAGLPSDTLTVPVALQIYSWVAIKDGVGYRWDTTLLRWVAFSSAASPVQLCNSFTTRISITYIDSFDFAASEGQYNINCVPYNSDSATFTLDTADDNYDRYDVFYADETGVHVLKGIAEELATVPSLEAGQLFIAWVRIPANSIAPAISQLFIYNENIEWTGSLGSGATADFDNTTNVYIGSKAVNWSTVGNADHLLFTNGSSVDLGDYDAVSLFIWNKQVVASGANLFLRWYNGTTPVSNEVLIPINKATVGSYQAISIPLSLFTIQNYNANRLRIIYRHSSAAINTGFYIDDIFLESGLVLPGGPGNDVTIISNIPAITVQESNDNFTLSAIGNSSQYIDGTGTLRTFNAVTTVGAFGSQASDPNGAVISGSTIYFQPVTSANPGMPTPAMKASWDSVYTAENMSSLGDSIIVNIDAARTGFKALVEGANITITPTDSTLVIASTGGGSSLTEGEGTRISGDSIHLGGTIGAESFLQNERVINANRKIMHWTNGIAAEAGGAYWQFAYRPYSPFQFISRDTVPGDNQNISAARPLSGLYARRTIFFPAGTYKTQQSYGHYLGQTYNFTDSMLVRTDGGDYQHTLEVEQKWEPLGSGTPQVARTGHGTNGNLKRNEGVPVIQARNSIFSNGTDRFKFNGNMVGFNDYTASSSGTVNDTINMHTSYRSGSFFHGKILKDYFLLPEGPFNVDSAFFTLDTMRARHYHRAGNSVLGHGPVWSSSDKLRVYGNVNISDSLIVGTQTEIADTTGMDVVMRRRADGSYVRIRADLLGVGGGGGWDDMLAPLQVQTDDREIDQGAFLLYWHGSNATLMTQIQNTGAGDALLVSSDAGAALKANSLQSYGIHAQTFFNSNTAAARFSKDKTTSNSVEPVLDLVRFTASEPDTIATNGIGQSINFYQENGADETEIGSKYIVKSTDVTNGSEDENVIIQNRVAGVLADVFTIGNAGQLKLAAGYPANTFNAAAVYDLGVDASGNVVTTATGVGGATPNLQEVTDEGNTTTNSVTASDLFSKPSYTSNWTSAMSYTGNGTSAYGNITLREFSTGAGNTVTLSPLDMAGDIELFLPEGSNGDTLSTKAYARSVGGGGGSDGNFAENDLTFDGNRAHALAGNTLSINQGANSFLSIDPTAGAEVSFLRAFNTTADDNVAQFLTATTNDESTVTFLADFNNGVKAAQILGSANTTESTLAYTADTHTFTGSILPVSDNSTDIGSAAAAFQDIYGRIINLDGSTSDGVALASDALGNTFSGTVLSGTGIISPMFWARETSNVTLVNSTAEQAVFNSTQDEITVTANTTYRFWGTYYTTHGSTSHNVQMGFTPTTATISSIFYYSVAHGTAANTQTTTQTSNYVNQATSTAVVTAAANAAEAIHFKGTITIGTGGTLKPFIKFSADPTGTILILAGTEIFFQPIGTDIVTKIGPFN